MPKRILFLDNIKSFVVVLTIMLHLGMCYMAFAPEWWYVVDYRHNSIAITQFVAWADAVVAPVMFFIAGFFAVASMARNGNIKWLKRKAIRIVVPFVLGVVILVAPVTYMSLYSRGVPIDYSTYMWSLFLVDSMSGGVEPGVLWSHAQYWFLGNLLLFYALLWLLSKLSKGMLKRELPGGSEWKSSVLVFFLIAASSVGISYFMGNDNSWVNLSYVFSFQPCRILSYGVCFFWGVYAWRRSWFEQDGYSPSQMKWVPAFVVASFTLPLWVLYGTLFVGDNEYYIAVKSLFGAIIAFLSVMGLMSFFQQNANSANSFFRGVSKASYGMYWIYMPVIFPMVYFMVPYDIDVWVKYAITGVAGVLFCYVLGRILALLPFFKREIN